MAQGQCRAGLDLPEALESRPAHVRANLDETTRSANPVGHRHDGRETRRSEDLL